MLITTALFAAVVVALVGGFIFWANPARRVNQFVGLGTLQTAAWLGCWHMVIISTDGHALQWVRWTATTGALTPLGFWIVKESILSHLDRPKLGWFLRNWAWLILPIAVAVIPLTEFYIPSYSTPKHQVFGWGYYLYMVAEVVLYTLLLYTAMRASGAVTGGQKLELQVWLGGGCVMFIAMWGLSAMSKLTGDPGFRRMMPFAALIFYAGTAVAITVRRVFDARQVLALALQKAVLISSLAGSAYVLYGVLEKVFLSPIPFLITVSLGAWFAVAVNGWLDRLFQFYPEGATARQAAFAAGARASRLEDLEVAFLNVLKGWGHAENALVLAGGKGVIRGGGLELSEDSPALASLRELRWATPERLARERQTEARQALGVFMAEHALGVLVMAEGATLTTIVGVGTPASRRPFTYPQVMQLRELASIMQSALERAHFSVKAQHAEQLATVGLLGASLAHEIRNPLVTIKTFVQLLPTRYNEPAFREKFFELIGGEVGRIDRLTEQLLDLATPRVYQPQRLALHPVLEATVEIVASKASEKQIELRTDFRADPAVAIIDAAATKQVMLNLCLNAVQAVERCDGERWVRIATRNVDGGVETIVEDSGPGIAPGIRPRLFQPFQSTKSSGFGLGLAICSDILAAVDASISVDAPEPGRGATFRVVFPCAASSS